ncbi:hypothetical protein CH275_01695 [Rhodococcus sp. 06-235-1A]|uniref:condensation domain-containing protein n=1 Tax=Rhodococcus sp. 06-235-1A TaxID=2022508 RepID=UPI000B9C2664|nr:condensation domain-containing protein [Rhodococcus sp. 06-235-1A]OZD10410.1 hypothetical protein CH275_01695 [Rhodococcus sp. 06-235-1A]
MRLELTGAQRGILKAQQLDPQNPAFNIAEYVDFLGALNVDRFVEALRTMIAETDATRLTVVTDKKRSYQRVGNRADVPVEVVDLTDRSDPEHDALEIMQGDVSAPLNPAVDTLCRHIVFRIGSARFFWYHRAHHFALDGYSFALIGARVSVLYRAASAGRIAPGASTRSLADVIAEDQSYVHSAQRLTDRAYWTSLLSGSFAPTLSVRNGMPSNTFRRSVIDFPEEQFVALARASHLARVVWSDLLLGVVAAMTACETGVADVSLGVPISNRLGSCAAETPCMILGAIAVPVRVEPAHSVAAIARTVFEQLRQSRKHARYRYEDLRAETQTLGGDRRLFGPVVNIMAFDYDLNLPGISATAHNLTPGPVEDITIDIYRRSTGSGLTVCIDVNPRRYDDVHLARIHQLLTTMISAAIADPHSRTDDLSRIIVPVGPVPSDTEVADVMESIADLVMENPAAPALAGTTGSTSFNLTRRQLMQAANTVADAVRTTAPTSKLIVFYPMGNGRDIVVMLAALLLGTPYMALDANAADFARRMATVRHLHPAAVYDSSTRAATTNTVADATPVQYPAEQPDSEDRVLSHASTGDAYTIFTSGSTGTPKAIAVSRRNLNAFIAGVSAHYCIDHLDRVLQFAPLHADTSVEEVFLTLTAGATLVVASNDDKRSLGSLITLVRNERITVLDLPTALWHELVVGLERQALDLPESVRMVIIGGEAASATHIARWHELAADRHWTVRLINTYGPSEATVVATTAELRPQDNPNDGVPIGGPISTVGAFLLVDNVTPDDGSRRIGELCLYGPTVARAYTATDSENGNNFGTVVLGRGTGDERSVHAYRTGDLVSASDDGLLRFIGRTDDQVKISGHRVEPTGIDKAIATLPGVANSATVIARRGGIMPTIHSFVVASDCVLNSADIGIGLNGLLPTSSRPNSITIVDSLPLTGNGKLNRAALVAMVDRTPTELPSTSATHDTEAAIVAVWAEVTGTAEITADSDFFLLGGHSMHTIAAANRLSGALGLDVRPELIFTNPTARGLARELDTLMPSGTSSRRQRTAMMDDFRTLTRIKSWSKVHRLHARGLGRHVLLTGATGFVGIHVLRELLAHPDVTVTVLIRGLGGENPRDSQRNRILRQCEPLSANEIRRLMQDVHIIPGDLAAPRLALSDEQWGALAENITDVINCAAVVSPLRPYTSVRPVNTVAVSELLALCRDSGGATFHQLSTVGVASDQPVHEFIETKNLPGYLASKAIAEEIVRAAELAGLPVSIIRLGRVIGSRRTDAVNAEDTLWTVLRACAAIGSYPVVDVAEPLSCVDDVAAAIVAQVKDSSVDVGIVRTLGPPSATPFVDIVRAVGLIDRSHHGVEIEQWRALVAASDHIASEHKQLISVWCSVVRTARIVPKSDIPITKDIDGYCYLLPVVSDTEIQRLADRDRQFRTRT